jgi:hypothetical protein
MPNRATVSLGTLTPEWLLNTSSPRAGLLRDDITSAARSGSGADRRRQLVIVNGTGAEYFSN